MASTRRDVLKSAIALPVGLASMGIAAAPSRNNSHGETAKPTFNPQYHGLINFHNPLIDHLFPLPELFLDQEFDVIVIGSGMGGGTVANHLSNLGVKTLVLEAGTLLLQTTLGNLPIDQDFWRRLGVVNFRSLTPETTADLATYIGLGGKSATWTGHVIPRYSDAELDCFPVEIRSYLEGEGYEEAEARMFKAVTRGPFEDTALNELTNRLKDDKFRIAKLPISNEQPNVRYADSGLEVKNWLRDTAGTYSTLDVLMSSSKLADPGHAHLFVATNRLVKGLMTDQRRITSIVCNNMVTGLEERFKAKYVILAAGTIESAAIAQRSRLKDQSNKIGKGLTDAPTLKFAPFPLKNVHGLEVDGQDHARFLITHTDSAAWPFNIQFLVNPQYWRTRNADFEVTRRTAPSSEQCAATGELFIYFNSQLDERNSIELPNAGYKPNVTIYPNDIKQSEHKQLAEQAIKSISKHLGITTPRPGLYYTSASSHLAGSLRISADDKIGVVDSNLRFHQYENLYCADLSVMPIVSASQPSLTLVALATRLAHHLKGFM